MYKIEDKYIAKIMNIVVSNHSFIFKFELPMVNLSLETLNRKFQK